MSFQDINTQTANFNRMTTSSQYQQASNQDISDSQQQDLEEPSGQKGPQQMWNGAPAPYGQQP